MKKTLYIYIITISFISCQKEQSTYSNAYLMNGTLNNIRIIPYSRGLVDSNHIINLNPNQKYQIADRDFTRGINGQSGFLSPYLDFTDSFKVTYNSQFEITHYNKPNILSLSKKFLPYNSLRNIGHLYSYKFEYEDVSKHLRRNTYTFTFTNDDYLFASQ